MLKCRADSSTGHKLQLYWNNRQVAKCDHDKYWAMEVDRVKKELADLKADVDAGLVLAKVLVNTLAVRG